LCDIAPQLQTYLKAQQTQLKHAQNGSTCMKPVYLIQVTDKQDRVWPWSTTCMMQRTGDQNAQRILLDAVTF